MTEDTNQPVPEPTATPVIDQMKLQMYMQEVRDNQNLSMALLGGAAAAVIGASLWALITSVTGWQIGFMAVGVGILVGYVVQKAGKGVDMSFGLVGAVMSLLGCLGGNLLVVCVQLADQEGIGVFETVSGLDLDLAIELMTVTFSPMDLVFYGIAVYEGYRFSIRQLTEEELAKVTRVG